MNISVSGVQSNELPPAQLMETPKPVPVLNGKTASFRDVERLAMERGAHGEYHRQWVISLQDHLKHVQKVKNRQRTKKAETSVLPAFLR